MIPTIVQPRHDVLEFVLALASQHVPIDVELVADMAYVERRNNEERPRLLREAEIIE